MTMTIEGVIHDYPAPGPPGDATLHLNPDDWHRFSTGDADAWLVMGARPGTFLLHKIESRRRGDGGRLMRAINRWGDELSLIGMLVCDENVRLFYEKFGWESAGLYGDNHTHEMRRLPRKLNDGVPQGNRSAR